MEIRFVGGPIDGHVRDINPHQGMDILLIADNPYGKYEQYGRAYYWVTKFASMPHPVKFGYRQDYRQWSFDPIMVSRSIEPMLRRLGQDARDKGYVLDLETVKVDMDPERGMITIEVIAGERERESGAQHTSILTTHV